VIDHDKNNFSDAKRRAGAKGALVRAQRLSAEERSGIARAAAEGRWIPKATHEGLLHIGDAPLPCFNLPDGRRFLSQSGMIDSLDMRPGSNPKRGGDRLSNFVAGKGVSPFVSEQLAGAIRNPIRFRTRRGSVAFGYEATVLADLCNAVIDARLAGKLQTQQEHIVQRCRALQTGFSKVGIIALVDEATGYQAERDRDELHKLLEKYISAELLPWTKRFPDEFYRQIYRLMHWQYPRGSNHPWFVGKVTKSIVYKRLPPGVLDELERKNPTDEGGARKYRHHQWLSEEVGNPHLRDHLIKVITTMQVSDSWSDFRRKLTRVAPMAGEQGDLFASAPTGDPDLEPPG
jgi:hypothetical protein